MFEKILIANRGEIACRVIRSCRKLGIKTVAVYSDADIDAPHVALADEKVRLGPPAATESYLLIEKIVDACKSTGAQAVHPGYGFLSENAAFAKALDAAGVTFIGPPVSAIEAMGDKIESKKLAVQAGVTTVPGHPDAIDDPESAKKIAAGIGYPVMVKAAAGGGGKGMRVAWNEAELIEGFQRSRSEARSSFGDDRVFLEKFIDEPRHIEIQVLADKHGNAIHLGERECSIQRRHQKVIEEAPSPFLDEATREAMGAEAVALAKAVDYCSAGTVEFIADGERNFYFLEMNTRLQVEHPVTELVTGIDLVEQMIKIADGERLTIVQSDVVAKGWAMEARVYAEDPAKGFLPSTGRLVRYIEPEGEGIRCDSGVIDGGEVSMFYDPMIAKLCAHGLTRDQAIDRLCDALDGYVIDGPAHNLDFLASVLASRRFRSGRLSTNFIAQEYGDRFEGEVPAGQQLTDMVAVATVMQARELARAKLISGRIDGLILEPDTFFAAAIVGQEFDVESIARQAGSQNSDHAVTINGTVLLQVNLNWHPGRRIVHAKIDNRALTLRAKRLPEGYELSHKGATVPVTVRRHRAHELARLMPEKPAPDLSKFLMSPMPGLIVSLAVEPGDQVQAGQELCILEAMKMENVLRAEDSATIAEIQVGKGDSVSADQVLMTFE